MLTFLCIRQLLLKIAPCQLHYKTKLFSIILYNKRKEVIGGFRLREYMIYLIEEEVAKHYSGNELKLFQLFQQYEQEEPLRSIIKRQVDYVTLPVPTFPLQQTLEQALKNKEGYKRVAYQHKIEKEDSTAKLSIFEKYLKLSSTGSFEAEAIFFEIIRKQAPYFLAIDSSSNRYGWLQPIKQRKFV